LRILKFSTPENKEIQNVFLKNAYKWTVALVGLGGFCLFYFSQAGMVQLLDIVTVISFLVSPNVHLFFSRY